MDDDIVVVMPWVYILRCGDNTFYVGHSADVESRLHWHRLGFGANHTALRLPVDLAYTEEYASVTDAVTRERQLKHWSGEKKAALIAGDRDRLKQLSKRRCRKINRSKINSFNLDSETSRAYSLRHWRAQSMRWTPMILAAVSLFGSAAALSQGQGQVRAPEVPPTDTIAEDIPGVIRGGTKIEVVIANVPGHGDPGVTLQGTEGPIALPDGTMVFCETILARVARVEKDGKESVFVDAALAGGPNGLTWDPKGRLIGATTAPGKVGVRVVYPKGSEATLADNFEGKPFVRPNDLIADKKGGVYFTDPANAPNPSLPPAVYYLPPGGGKVIKVVDDVNPNGVTLSPDEKILYVNSGGTGYVLAFDVQNDGTLTNRRNFAKYEGLTVTDGKVVGGGDGFTVDTQGRLYTAAAGKIQVFTSQGAYLGSITPSRRPQNLAFAGPDMKTLYVVGGGTVFKVQMLAQGIKSRGGK